MMAVGFDGIDLGDSIRMMQCSTLGRDGLISDHVLAMAGKLKGDELILDNASTINLFGNNH